MNRRVPSTSLRGSAAPSTREISVTARRVRVPNPAPGPHPSILPCGVGAATVRYSLRPWTVSRSAARLPAFHSCYSGNEAAWFDVQSARLTAT